MVAGIAVDALGHAHPAIQKVLTEQGAKLLQTSNLFYSIPQIELAKLLTDNSPFDKVFFANSGAEANEAAIKLARKYGRTRRDNAFSIITAEKSFHGRTLATITATATEAYKRPFAPLPEGFVHVPLNDMDALEKAVDGTTAAVLLEVIQGESGVNSATVEYLRAVRELCTAKNILFMLDEVQTGIGRLGTLWGFEKFGVEPDLITLAKGLGGGVPIGAMLVKDQYAALVPGDHGSTFGGNVLMCAVANEVVRYVIEEGVLDNVNRVGAHLKAGLNTLKNVTKLAGEARGEGLLLALELTAEVGPQAVRAGLDEGILFNATGPTTLRFVPPLILTEAEADEAVEKVGRVLRKLEAAQA
jgi:predicted acetylornithine/succinylornithine family transaminase